MPCPTEYAPAFCNLIMHFNQEGALMHLLLDAAEQSSAPSRRRSIARASL
jgi:hypothetical protein